MNEQTFNRRERKAARLLRHYETLEALARRLGVAEPNGKEISAALVRLENKAHRAATAQCNGEPFEGQPFRSYEGACILTGAKGENADDCTTHGHEESDWELFTARIRADVAALFNSTVPPGLFINGDARGYALKIDNETPEGKKLIDTVRMHTDWGGYGILSPEITGD